MGNLIILAWWLSLLAALQAASRILDAARHLEWGLLGFFALKGVYLGFSMVILGRYLSFRAQRNFETLEEAYRRAAGKSFGGPERKSSRFNPIFNLALAFLSVADALLGFFRNLPALKASILLDFLIWVLIARWVTRAYWLKARRARERLKEAVDDARSRSKPPDAAIEAVPERIPPYPFLLMAGLSLILAAGLSWSRWKGARSGFRVGELQVCMEKTMRLAADRFYREGGPAISLGDEPCVRERAGQVDFALDWSRGDLYLRAFESPASDFFGDGLAGNQGWVLDANGRFRPAWGGTRNDSVSGPKTPIPSPP